MQSDEELVKSVAENDEQAFYELFKRYENKILNLIYRLLGSYQDAEEAIQDVFFKVYKGAHTFRGESKFSTWLHRIAINTCKNVRRKKRPSLVSIDAPDAVRGLNELSALPSTEPEHIFAENATKTIILQALHSLAPNQKTAFILSKYEGYSYAEIGEIMKISDAAVGLLLFRAKQALKKKLLPHKKRGVLWP